MKLFKAEQTTDTKFKVYFENTDITNICNEFVGDDNEKIVSEGYATLYIFTHTDDKNIRPFPVSKDDNVETVIVRGLIHWSIGESDFDLDVVKQYKELWNKK